MALDTVNKIKQAEQSSIQEEAAAKKQADEYVKSSLEKAQFDSTSKIKQENANREQQIADAKAQAKALIESAKKEAEKDTKALYDMAAKKENEVINRIIEKII